MALKLSFASAVRLLCFPLAIDLVLYGIFTVLFIVALILLHQGKQRAYWLNLITTVMLFSLATGAIVVGIAFQARSLQNTLSDTPPITHTESSLLTAASVLYSVANLVTDIVLIYRCYVIWNRRKIVVIPSALFTIANTLFPAIMAAADVQFRNAAYAKAQEMPFALSLILNMVSSLFITSLTAGRILWITRRARGLIGAEAMRRYRVIMTIIIESGILYPLSLVPFVVLLLIGTKDLLLPALVQIVGIVPTLVLVCVGLGINVESSSTVVAAEQSNQSRDLPAPAISLTTPYVSQGVDVELSAVEDSGQSGDSEPVDDYTVHVVSHKSA